MYTFKKHRQAPSLDRLKFNFTPYKELGLGLGLLHRLDRLDRVPRCIMRHNLLANVYNSPTLVKSTYCLTCFKLSLIFLKVRLYALGTKVCELIQAIS